MRSTASWKRSEMSPLNADEPGGFVADHLDVGVFVLEDSEDLVRECLTNCFDIREVHQDGFEPIYTG